MPDYTTVQIDRRLLQILNKLKTHPRQSYNEVILQIVEDEEGLRRNVQNAQRHKMKELWDNKADEEWEYA